MNNSEDIGQLSMHENKAPKPKSRALLWIFLCLIAVIGATLWFVRDMIFHDSTGKQTSRQIDSQTSSLPTEVMGSTTSAPSEQGGEANIGQGNAGTNQSLAEQSVPASQKGILEMLDGGKNANSAEGDTDTESASEAVDADGKPILSTADEQALQETAEDAVMRAAFTEDLAPWLVSLYYPQKSHPQARKSGIVLADISRINQRYGIQMTGLSWSGDSIHEGRASVLEYIFMPSMIDSLYALYVDRFMAGIATAAVSPRADGTTLTEAQREEMYTLYAQHLRSYASALDGIVRMNGLSRSVEAWQLTTDKALEANAEFTARLFDYESARDAGKSAEAAEARKQMDAAGKAYQQAIIMRERARESLAESLRSSVNARRLDESSLLYLATWVKRRLDASPQNKESLQSISSVLKDLSTRFDAAKESVKGDA